ncbi:hypothetical protein JCM8097_002134 [Rhodosporidiobolus ruineniae]
MSPSSTTRSASQDLTASNGGALAESSGAGPDGAGVIEQKPSLAGPRKTQRAPASCSYCARRKVKCEKVFPCARCIKQGIADQCTREVVLVKGRVVGGEQDEAVARREFTLEDYVNENKALRRMLREAIAQKGSASAELDVPLPPPINPLSGSSTSSPPRKPTLNIGEHKEVVASDLAMVGMEPAGGFDEGEAKRPRAASPDVSYLIPFAPGVTRSSRLRYLLSLIPLSQSRDLVARSLHLVGWIHGVLHTESFLREHDELLEAVQRGQFGGIRYEWLSTYFAVLASGAYFIGDWDRQQLYTPEQRLEFPRLWFSAALETLYLSEFMTRHTLGACQSVCILTLVAFNFGASAHLISLLHIALRIAQTLGLHLLVAEPENEVPTPGVQMREIGRCVWGAISLGDALSPASQQPHALFFPEAVSVTQANLNQEEIVEGQLFRPHPLPVWTRQATHIFLNHVGRLFRRFNREFWSADSLEQQFDLACQADAELCTLLDNQAHLKVSDAPYPAFIDLDGEIPYQRWQQHHMAVNFPRLRIGLFRCFLRKSYEDKRFAKSRQICLDGARQIIKERQRVVPALFDRAWHITSDTVAAGVILCAMYREEKDLHEKRRLYDEVQACIAVLSKGGTADNNLVGLGINLLNSYITSPPPSPPTALSASSAPPPAAQAAPAWPTAHSPTFLSTQQLQSVPLQPPIDPTLSLPPQQPDGYLPTSSAAAASTLPYHVPAPYNPSTPGPAASTAFASASVHSLADGAEAAVPDLWSSLEMAGGGGAFDPFGGWEGAAGLEWSWFTPLVPPPAGPGEYDPSRPAF